MRQDHEWQSSKCDRVSYTENNDEDAPRLVTKGCKEYNSLSFSFVCESHDEIYFCSYPPYTYTMLCSFLAQLSLQNDAAEHLVKTELNKTLTEYSVPLLIITQSPWRVVNSSRTIGINRKKMAEVLRRRRRI